MPAQRLRRIAACSAAALVLGLIPTGTAQAARACASANVGGKAIGWVDVDGTRVPIKPVSYPAGGTLAPPDSAKVVGLSKRHRPLLAKQGTTVLTWHVRYGQGCYGSLNVLLDRPVGSTFTVTTASGAKQEYRLVKQTTVKKGKYKAEWFRTQGSPQLALFTCSDLRNGQFRKTTALIAEPVNADAPQVSG